MAAIEFTAKLVRPPGVGTWTFVRAPAAVSKSLATKARVPVAGTVGGAKLRGSLLPDGKGGHYLVVKKEVRDAAGVTEGDRVEVRLEVDRAARTVELPAALAAALRKDRAAKAAFDALSYSKRLDCATWIAAAKRDETRDGRVATALARLAQGLAPRP